MLKVGFTGTRHGMTLNQKLVVHQALQHLRNKYASGLTLEPHLAAEFHHGDCVGADEQADLMARYLGYRIVIHPPKDPNLRAWCRIVGDVLMPELGYKERNRKIVQMTDWMIATPQKKGAPNQWGGYGGTWYTIEHTIQQGSFKRLWIIDEQGTEMFHGDHNVG